MIDYHLVMYWSFLQVSLKFASFASNYNRDWNNKMNHSPIWNKNWTTKEKPKSLVIKFFHFIPSWLKSSNQKFSNIMRTHEWLWLLPMLPKLRSPFLELNTWLIVDVKNVKFLAKTYRLCVMKLDGFLKRALTNVQEEQADWGIRFIYFKTQIKC